MVQLHGTGAAELLRQLTGRDDWPANHLRLVDLAGIDTALAVRGGDDWVQLMPHGGVRVVQRLIERVLELGAVYEAEPTARALYPEATSAIEADVLATIARAASPTAIDLLAAQPALWRGALKKPTKLEASREALLAWARVLDRLITPASVVVVGRPNVGKSTLANAMLGKAVSVVADLPGTTRDWVGGLAELSGGPAGSAGPVGAAVAVHWLDTPGLRAEAEGRGGGDAVEHRAIALARRMLEAADVLIAMRDPVGDWPEATDLPRVPDVWVVNKMDDAAAPAAPAGGAGASRERPLAISAAADRNLEALTQRVLAVLGLDAIGVEALWAFSPALREAVGTGAWTSLQGYVGMVE